jgi:hypothetical protein
LNAAIRKTSDIDDGKAANIRVAHGVLTGGGFSASEICAEYFGGILASSRTDEGQDDDAIQFVEVTKSLSSMQLHMHYVVYNRLNKLFFATGTEVNIGMERELSAHRVWFSTIELVQHMNLKVDTDLHILHKHGLLKEYGINIEHRDDGYTPYCFMSPSTFGVLLYAVAHNRYAQWRQFNSVDFGDYEGIALPSIYESSLQDLISVAAIKIDGTED